MDFSLNRSPDRIEILMSGQFTFHFNQKFKEIIALVDSEKLQSITINLRDVEFIDSAGLGMLLLLRDQCMERDIALFLLEAQGQVDHIFTVSKFDQLFGASATEH